MKKRVLQIICFVCAIICMAFFCISCDNDNNNTDLTRPELMERVLKSVCTVQSDENFGTGFVFKTTLDKTFIMTNEHIINGQTTAKLRFFDGLEASGTVLGVSSYYDIAVIVFDNPNNSTKFLPLEFIDQEAVLGQDAFLIGNALNQGLAAFEGIVSNPVLTITYTNKSTQSTKRVPVIGITVPVNEGASGSPVFDNNGRVFGVGTYQMSQHNGRDVVNMSYATPSKIALSVANQIIAQNPDFEPSFEECFEIQVRLRVSGNDSDALYIDFEGLNFFASFKNGVLEVLNSVDIALSFGQALKAGDRILSIGELEIKNATLFDIFYEVNKYIDDRLSSAVTSKLLTIRYESDGAIKEVGFLNKYEKNY